MAIHGVSKCHGVNQYIHNGYNIISMKFENYLVYVPIWEHTSQEFDDINHVMITLDHQWDPNLINDKL